MSTCLHNSVKLNPSLTTRVGKSIDGDKESQKQYVRDNLIVPNFRLSSMENYLDADFNKLETSGRELNSTQGFISIKDKPRFGEKPKVSDLARSLDQKQPWLKHKLLRNNANMKANTRAIGSGLSTDYSSANNAIPTMARAQTSHGYS